MALRYFLALCALICCPVSGQPPTYGLLGQELHLGPSIKGQPDDILWTHDGNKVVEFNGKEEQVYSPYENRVTLDWVSAELTITDLRREDSGRYELEAFVNRKMHPFDKTVEVIGKVSKPTISCDMSNGSSDARGAQATLTCSADATDPWSLMKYEWESSGNVSPGRELTIFLEDEHEDKTYSCSVSNPLSVDKATFSANNCYSGESSSVALVAILIALLIGLFIVGVGILFCKRKHKACFAKRNGNDVEKSRAATKDQIHELELLFDRKPTLPSQQRLPNYSANIHKEDMTNNLDTEEEENMNREDEMPPPGTVRKRRDQYERNLSGAEKNADKDEITESPPLSPPGRKPSFGQDQDKVSGNDKGDSDADQLGGSAEEADEINPAGVLDDSEDTPSDVASSTAPEQSESEEERDENEEVEPPLNVLTHAAVMPRSPLTQNSLAVGTDDAIGEHEEDDDSDQETSQEHVKDSHSPVTESHDSSEESQPSTAPEQNCSGTAGKDSDLSGEETPTGEDDQLEKKKTVSEDESESGRASDDEEIETEQNPSSDISEQPPSPTQKETAGTQDSEDTLSDVDSSTAPEQPVSESEEEKDENEETKSPLANVLSPPAVMPRSPLTQSSPAVGTDDTIGEHEEDDHSDQEPSQEHFKDSHSPVTESHDSSEESQPSSTKMVSEDESELGRASDGEEIETEQNPSSDISEQPPSPTQKETDNANINTSEESLNSAHAEPDHDLESKTRQDPDESEGQVDDSAEEEEEEEEDKSEFGGKTDQDQFSPKKEEEEPGNKSPSSDKEVHTGTEVSDKRK